MWLHGKSLNEKPSFNDELSQTDEVIDTKQLDKYKNSTYNGELIKNVKITLDGGIIVETDSFKKTFYTHFSQDVLNHIDGYSGDYIICMIQNFEGINVSKY